MNIYEGTQTAEIIAKEDIYGEIRSKRRKKSVVADSDEDEPDEKPSYH